MGRNSGVKIGLLVLVAMALASTLSAQSDEAARIDDAAMVLQEIMDAPDHAIPAGVLKKAVAVAIFPSTLKGGLFLGAHRGRGIICARDPKTGAWSSPGFLTLTGGSVGAQIGAQAVDLVLIVMGQRGLENLLKNNFKIGADASVAAGPVGRDAEASTDIQLRAQILSYSRTRGLFAGVTLKGSAVRADRDANERFYGVPYSSKNIVLEGKAGEPEPIPALHAILNKYVP